jgi:hypothetical protein
VRAPILTDLGVLVACLAILAVVGVAAMAISRWLW